MFYLSDLVGGFTAFPNMGVAARPSAGSAVFWYNLDRWLPGKVGRCCICIVLSGSAWRLRCPCTERAPPRSASSGSATSGSGRESRSVLSNNAFTILWKLVQNFVHTLTLDLTEYVTMIPCRCGGRSAQLCPRGLDHHIHTKTTRGTDGHGAD